MVTRTRLASYASTAALLTAMMSGSAYAAGPATLAPVALQADAAQTPADVAEDGDGKKKDEITVTGTRVRLPGITSFEPITTITAQYIEDRGLTNVADAVNELPGVRGSVTPAGGQGPFGQAANFINTFNLGSNRTLTLVNGRRYVSSNVNSLFAQGAAGTQVDINVIPASLVQRVDFVTVGGAPVYGSDAIAGTFNYILNTKFEGLEVRGLTGISEQGDAFRYNVNVTGGLNFNQGRGNLTLSYTRDRQDGLLQNARGFFQRNVGGATNPTTAQAAALGRAAGITFANDGRLNTNIGFNDTATDGFPGTVQVDDLRIPFLTQGGLITGAFNAAGGAVATPVRNFQFDPSGNLVPFNRGIPFVGINSSGGDGFRFSDFGQITSSLTRDIFNGYFNYEISPAVKLFLEGTYYSAFGDELVQQPTFNSSLFGGASGALTFDVTSPFLTAQARSLLQAQGVSRIQVSRASTDLADPTGFSNINLYRVVVGLKGDLKLFGGRDFNYEVYGNYGRTTIVDSVQDLNAQNFINAVNVTTNAAGQIVCTATPTRQAVGGGTPIADPACVPLNLLGLGVSSPAARAYVLANTEARSVLQQTNVVANFNGSPFKLFGNDVGFSVGYEYRREQGAFTPSSFLQRGLGRGAATQPVRGSYTLNEVFGEVVVPLISKDNNIPLVEEFQLIARGRYVDNSVNGGFFTWSAGASYTPIRDVRFRGNYTKAFRSPAITELFSPQQNAFSAVPDLCSPTNINGGAVPLIRARNCAAFLGAFPNATPLDAAAATVPSRGGGNPNLANEVSRNFTVGVVIEPRWIPGLAITVDYINIKIAQPIANLAVAAITGACFDNSNFNTADPANGNAFCSQLRRFPAGTPASVATAANGGSAAGQINSTPADPGVLFGFVNGQRISYNGIQAGISYLRPLSGLGIPGRIGLDGSLNYAGERIVDLTGVAPVRVDGTLGDPTWQGQFNLRYLGKGWGVTGSFNYIGEQLFSRVTRGPDIREVDKLKAYILVNPSIFVNINQKFRLNFSVTNASNWQGQRYFGAILPASFADNIGRRFSMQATAKF